MAYLPTYRLKLYRNFKALDAADYHGIVRFYEQFEDAIATLDTDEYFDCTLAYTEALFEIENYGQHLVMCDHLLEFVIMQNIETWGGEDIYTKLLFRKALALYRLEDYPQSAHILRELIKLKPRNALSVKLLRRCLLNQRPRWMSATRAVALALSFLAVAVIALELFVIGPFFMDYYPLTLVVHNALIAAAVLVFAGGECWHSWRCHRAVRNFVGKVCARKRVQPQR